MASRIWWFEGNSTRNDPSDDCKMMNSKSTTLEGIAASSGVAIGQAFLFSHEELDVPRVTVDESDVDDEMGRYQSALEQTRHELAEIRERSRQEMSDDHAQIFQAHLVILEDPMFVDEIPRKIQDERINAECAVIEVSEKIIEQFSRIDNELIGGRVADIRDLVKRVVHNLLGKERSTLASLTEEVIIVAHDLSPSDTVLMDKEFVLGFATDVGSRTSHTAIMAHAYEIPAVVGMGNVTKQVKTGDMVIIDGHHGKVMVNPDKESIEQY